MKKTDFVMYNSNHCKCLLSESSHTQKKKRSLGDIIVMIQLGKSWILDSGFHSVDSRFAGSK